MLRDSRLTQALVKLSLWIKHCTDLCGAPVMQAAVCVCHSVNRCILKLKACACAVCVCVCLLLSQIFLKGFYPIGTL